MVISQNSKDNGSFHPVQKNSGLRLAKDGSSPHPLYQKVKHYILDNITSGRWSPNSQIPSENQLVKSLKVSRMTVHRALRELSNDGFLARVQGVGTFVKTPRPKASYIEIRNIADEIEMAGGRHSCEIRYLSEESAGYSLSQKMRIKEGEKVFHSIIIHKNCDEPVQLSDRYVNAQVVPEYIHQDFSVITPHQYLMDIAPLQETEHSIEASLPSQEEQNLLNIDAMEPCLLLHRRTWSKGVVVTVNCFTCPSSRYQLGDRIRISG